jgi:hypothetical protein
VELFRQDYGESFHDLLHIRLKCSDYDANVIKL